MTDLLARLKGAVPRENGWAARCPAHNDQHSSLSIDHRDGRWLIKCHAGCDWRAITHALGMEAAELFDTVGEEGGITPPGNHATAQPFTKSSPKPGSRPLSEQSTVVHHASGLTLTGCCERKRNRS